MQLLPQRILPGICLLLLSFVIPTVAQQVAIMSPDGSEASRHFAEILEGEIAAKYRIVDTTMSEAAFASTKAADKFNMSVEESKAAGLAIGCDFFILVKAETTRRSSSVQAKYYESHAAVYSVSTRTGRLVFWALPRFNATTEQEAKALLNAAANPLASEIANKLRIAAKSELAEPLLVKMDEPPDADSPLARSLRTPIPYRRIKPEYTSDAFLYAITATVDIIVDLDERGLILRTEITRWAGYGLDESVEKAVRSMNWRPAERNGKPLPMRFLLRYNFKKTDKD
ncbi:MAG: energy transducer TonB [Chloracidobacterium sp.]|nr:energy transducer TonB [Chloracidobacterium sp.]